jgi:hypothetical protein
MHPRAIRLTSAHRTFTSRRPLPPRNTAYTINKFEGVSKLHQIMLVVTMFVVLGFMMLLYR